MSTSTIFIAVIALLLGVVLAVYIQKVVASVRLWVDEVRMEKEAKKAKAYEEELRKDINETKQISFTTTDGNVEIQVLNHKLSWIRVKGGEKYTSFEDLLASERMPKTTYSEVVEIQERLQEIQSTVQEEMYVPSYYTVIPTARDLGRDLVIYQHGDIRVTDRFILHLDENADGDLDLLGAFISTESLDTSRSIYELDFSGEDMKSQMELLLHHLSREEFAEEASEMQKIMENIEFYNAVMNSGKVEILDGRAYIKGILEFTEQPSEEEEEEKAPTRRGRIDEVLQNCKDGRPVIKSL